MMKNMRLAPVSASCVGIIGIKLDDVKKYSVVKKIKYHFKFLKLDPIIVYISF